MTEPEGLPLHDTEATRTAFTGRISSDHAGLTPGQPYGPYRIVRRLGQGGMGEVFEAEHVETSRRLALKRLTRPITTEVERARFLREGRLAASISNEHCIYVYGTEEIDSSPVIVMELARGGTLKDRVEAHGPLEPAAAVDAILHVVAGLEAAAAVGVLHRDVKPSNCFVGGDGTVKVGDFGLSISTDAGSETQPTEAGTVLGTPAFASPEQLSGRPLDVRSDIYSVGATLYYLLTGTPPFAGSGLVELVAKVLDEPPTPPARLRAGLPRGLEQMVLNCLAKQPADRPDSYRDLRRQLPPFSTQAPLPAALGSRSLAGLLDEFLTFTALSFVLELSMSTSSLASRVAVAQILTFLYFVTTEGFWGASPGKLLMGIRVCGADRQSPGIWSAGVRASAFLLIPLVLLLPFAILDLISSAAILESLDLGSAPGRWRDEVMIAAIRTAGFALLFATSRRGNGYAGVHDLISGTRVVRGGVPGTRELLAGAPLAVDVPATAPRLGPYRVLDSLGVTDTVVIGYDEVLRRRVWIHLLPVGAPSVSVERQDIARPGRLRWLTGRRTAVESWDAYEALEGQPVLSFALPAPWSAVRLWLLDLTTELAASTAARHRFTATSLEHVWITRSGRAIVLDIPAPRSTTGLATDSNPTDAADDPPGFLLGFAGAALGVSWDRSGHLMSPSRGPGLPLHARQFLSDFGQRRHHDLHSVIAALRALLNERATLTRRQRVIHLGLSAAVPTAAAVAALVSSAMRGSFAVDAVSAPLAGVLALLVNPAILSAALFRGGLMFQVLRVAVVGPDGVEVHGPRALIRALVAWSPVIVFLLALAFDLALVATFALLVLLAGLVVAAQSPERGLQDRLANTRLVPR